MESLSFLIKKESLSSSVFSALNQGEAAACATLIIKPLFFLSFTLERRHQHLLSFVRKRRRL